MRMNHSVIACSASTKQTCHALECEWYERDKIHNRFCNLSAALEWDLMHTCQICLGDAAHFVFLCGL